MPSIDANTRNRTDSYIRARQQHPAWQLLASRRAPLVLRCLQSLFETSQDGIGFDEALQSLADMLSQHANDSEFEISTTEFANQSRKELRSWIRSDLIIEREDRHLRQSIVSEQNNRGEIVDKFLDGHHDLLETAEGKAFHGFNQELWRSVDLDNMPRRSI